MEELNSVPSSFRTHEKVRTTSGVFRLNCGVTALLLMIASVIVTVKQFGGHPIECAVDKELAGDVVNNYCWIHSTFSAWKVTENATGRGTARTPAPVKTGDELMYVLRHQALELIDPEVLRTHLHVKKDADNVGYGSGYFRSDGTYPGVQSTSDETMSRYHKYVQWIPGILILQIGSTIS
ncbi:UNVERIFIED_CONTAM: hypothetical protein PYX00_003733 [Menopon gallinae]|uniref:Innexin n=1 Tax=Menopon gallinae TaxID=328185 RepID=A0AAW2I2R0_9NEOP